MAGVGEQPATKVCVGVEGGCLAYCFSPAARVYVLPPQH